MNPTERLLDLISHCRSRHNGVTLAFIMYNYGVSKRTAQRMTTQLEQLFPDCAIEFDENSRKIWKLRQTGYDPFLTLTADDLAVLELAGKALAASGNEKLQRRFQTVQNKIKTHIPANSMVKIEPDLDALLIAQGFAFRPYPAEQLDGDITETLTLAIKSGVTVNACYQSRAETKTKLELAPYGFVLGSRRYLAAYPVEDGEQRVPLRYRLEALSELQLTDNMFERDPEFDLTEFSSWAFGSYYHDNEYGEVIWKFSGAAADRAAKFRFHPDQEISRTKATTTVKFWAAGWLEMAWYLYQWGNQVEVIEPEGLRKMVEGHQRGDFPTLP